MVKALLSVVLAGFGGEDSAFGVYALFQKLHGVAGWLARSEECHCKYWFHKICSSGSWNCSMKSAVVLGIAV